MNMYSASKKSLLVLFGLSVSGIVFSQVEEGGQIEEKAQAKEDKQAIDVDDSYESTMTILGKTDDLKTSAGSANRIDQDELEKFEFDDIHQILSKIPGVNIRQEDGFGVPSGFRFEAKKNPLANNAIPGFYADIQSNADGSIGAGKHGQFSWQFRFRERPSFLPGKRLKLCDGPQV
jgi:hypothetical protein